MSCAGCQLPGCFAIEPLEGRTLFASVATDPGELTKLNDSEVLFAGHSSTTGDELWFSKGTKATTHLLLDINAGAGGSSINNISISEGNAYFTAFDGTSNGFWRTDGTKAGTKLIKTFGSTSIIVGLQA